MNCSLAPIERPMTPTSKQQCYEMLLMQARPDINTVPLAELISSWQCGQGVMPYNLGLKKPLLQQLLNDYFAINRLPQPVTEDRLDHRLDDLRLDLLRLLSQHSRSKQSLVIAELIATACQGSNHLWEDLGVWNRSSLSKLLWHNFPTLAQRNTRDMKWKKFLFKQLCETEGIYICRAPTCDECSDFDDCFGPE